MLGNINKTSYYKLRVIVTFAIVTVIIVIILARTGYVFIKDLYLTQLADQANIVAEMVGKQIEPSYLSLLELGIPTGTTEEYFEDLFEKNIDKKLHSEIFIFDEDLKTVIHSDNNIGTGETEPRLILNSKEIAELKPGNGFASLPFKGNDNNWYLWGFHRLDENYWIAVRESAERFEQVDELSAIFWFIGLGGVVITIIAGWIMANAITKPLNKLVEFSSEIGKGNFKVSQPEKMHGEIKLLSDAMNKMKNDLLLNQEEKEKILAQIAHEIRNPLGGIELLANLVKENNDDKEKNEEYISRILKEVNGLKMLITSYLNYSRPIPSSPSWTDVSKLVSEVENIFKVKITEKNALVVKNIELKKIYFDEGHLRQILVNLVANSLDSINDNGTIIITANESPKWEIVVNDDGKGINGYDHEKIFTPFFTTKKNGTGLGLAISKKLCVENGAMLSTQKEENGATFIISKEPVNHE